MTRLQSKAAYINLWEISTDTMLGSTGSHPEMCKGIEYLFIHSLVKTSNQYPAEPLFDILRLEVLSFKDRMIKLNTEIFRHVLHLSLYFILHAASNAKELSDFAGIEDDITTK